MPEVEPANAPASVPQEEVAEVENSGGDGKAKLVMSILRQFIGVKDMANVRFSLPAQLIEPIPNLEYWNYLDRPDYFICIGDSDDPIERMMSLLRWYLTKDLKLVHGKICKPYNSVLGEFFRCNWNTASIPTTTLNVSMLDNIPTEAAVSAKSTSRFKSTFSRKAPTMNTTSTNAPSSGPPTRSTSPTPSTKSTGSASGPVIDARVDLPTPIRTAFLCEQTSHHPPVSAYIYSCPDKDIEAYGMDQIAARFTGTTIKVQPGEQNEGIFVNLKGRAEEYQCTHPTASICGFLRGSLYAAVQDTASITCTKTGLKAILWYKDEPWIGKPKYAMEGIVFKLDPKVKQDNIKDVSEDAIIARLDGCWKNKIYIFNPRSKERHVLLDVSDLAPATKVVPSFAQQKSNESRTVWDSVTQAILGKKFETATKRKVDIEDAQRQVAKERAEKSEEFVPAYFKVNNDGRPTLTKAGEAVLAGQHNESWSF
ncbi:Putative uncharacterized protein [Taphrina deformans PYCC 5710]|uniref:Oxysterol binding protein n=1 Tax=Taphrina deformans (strain PYCC 5710 / ATCC 11124 / CBS 356.35 / IMI 108563 / JCM 9778 / NBRC 8474) TaxID=1097556 RepID=R4XAL5_TAPDE|nr:Putative uncharacterized protein [Taphrina deformans PYCC 5710]|eukprot:CCG82574.1 Putative uncharacterized protein [Taphrina deformans PYCC 5710]